MHAHLVPLSSTRHGQKQFLGGMELVRQTVWIKLFDESAAASLGKMFPHYFLLLCCLVSWQRVVSPCCAFWLDDSIKRPRWFTAQCVFMGMSVCFSLSVCLSACQSPWSLRGKQDSTQMLLFTHTFVGRTNEVITVDLLWCLLLDCLTWGCLCFSRLWKDYINVRQWYVTVTHSIVCRGIPPLYFKYGNGFGKQRIRPARSDSGCRSLLGLRPELRPINFFGTDKLHFRIEFCS